MNDHDDVQAYVT